ncbi:unnamed protein product [Orchesella dallaii]|uniref:Uncharacterized protein n=1 Tax=Orchesella dallaii TaxID=48710 RepID=A0ABP1QIB1_9HEXA
MSSTNRSDDTHQLMRDKIELLTAEKLLLEDRLSDITFQFEEKTRENIDLKSRLEDNLGSKAFYENTINSLLKIQEDQNTEMRNLREFYEDKFKKLSLEHETQRKLTEEANTTLQRSSRTNIFTQFQDLSTIVKGIIIVGIVAVAVAAKSTGFMEWVWPRLLNSIRRGSQRKSRLSCFSVLKEAKRYLKGCLKVFAKTGFRLSTLRMAPDLLRSLRLLISNGIHLIATFFKEECAPEVRFA